MNQHQHSIIPLAEPWLPPSCAEAVSRQIETSFVGPGPTAQSFASRLAQVCDVAAAVPVSSGTVALSIAAQALGLRPGDEVIVPAYGVISVINAFGVIGLRPRLAEIDAATGCIDPKRLGEAITKDTRAVVYVDFCGSIGDDLDEVAAICADRGVPLIEDAAWALGRGRPGRRGGSFGQIGTISFSVPKILTTGQGGAVLAHDEAQRDAAVAAADQGDVDWRRTNLNKSIGSNLRLSDLAAALGNAELDQIEERWARKRSAYSILAKHLGERLFRAADGDVPMQHIIFVERPDDVVSQLKSQGILAARQYRPMYHHPPYEALRDRDFKASEFWFAHSVYLPFGVGLTEEGADRIGVAVQRLNCRFMSPS
ncbi:MAG: aminotransferase class I/II-fold pyridoxal phosphate-dependent enzyme [Hyphomicrobiales bacterium]|nr:aminotransferase class I/II-fold pyridoxal phosphate-dependent enzyme [Hyphomicrobiales bacterium]